MLYLEKLLSLTVASDKSTVGYAGLKKIDLYGEVFLNFSLLHKFLFCPFCLKSAYNFATFVPGFVPFVSKSLTLTEKFKKSKGMY